MPCIFFKKSYSCFLFFSANLTAEKIKKEDSARAVAANAAQAQELASTPASSSTAVLLHGQE